MGSWVDTSSSGAGDSASRCVPELPILVISDRRLCSFVFVFHFSIFHRICCSPEVTCPEVPVDVTRFGIRILVPPPARTLITDAKSNVTLPLPYKRVSSPAHFRALIPGRRKAVEVSVLSIVNIFTASEYSHSGLGHVPSVRRTRNSDRIRRPKKSFLILALGTFSLGLQTQGCPFVKLCLDLGQPTPPLGRDRQNESHHQKSTRIRFAQSVVLNQRNVRMVHGKVPSTALVVTLLRCYAFHFWMSTLWLAHNHSII